MAQAKLFQYAILWQPSEEQAKNGEKAKLVVDLKTVLVNDEKAAFMVASREIPEEYVDKLDQLQIAVRPF